MTDTTNQDEARLEGADRASAVILALALAVPLAVACILKPDPSGHGTHRQLGMPPCSVVVLFGHRCPACGTTTAWAYLVRGRWIDAFRANVGGALLGILDLVAVPWLLASAWRRRWIGLVPTTTALSWVIGSIMVITLIDWAVRLAME